MKNRRLRPETVVLHSGYEPEQYRGAQAVPIIQSTSFRFRDSEHAASLFRMDEFGDVYSRIMNPTNEVLENRVAALEEGIGGLVFGSGQAAVTASILTIAGNGDEIIASRSLYGGTHNLFSHAFRKLGIKVHFIPINDIHKFRHLVNNRTRAVYTETISNPSLEIADIAHIAEVSHEAGIPLITDNTVTPYIFSPFKSGADIIVYSATKFIGGHGNSVGGILVDSGNFKWDSGRFPYISDPDPEFHGMEFINKFKDSGNIAYILKARSAVLRDFGGCLSPFNSFLILQGLETIHIRMREHLRNTRIIAGFLKNHKNTEWVNYPGIGNSENDNRAEKYFPDGAGSILGFGIKGGRENGKKFIDSLKLISHLANIGDSKTLAIHPATTTHSRMTENERALSGVTDDYIRLSIGLENSEDIIEDLDQALISSEK